MTVSQARTAALIALTAAIILLGLIDLVYYEVTGLPILAVW